MSTADLSGFAPVADLAGDLAAGRCSSRDLLGLCRERIGRLDGYFGAIRVLADDAGSQADASDRRRRAGLARGPLDGIPVLVKDNVDVAGLPTTAGALALADSRPAADAHLVGRLREAGAVILGKANLSELANFLAEDMPSGYSSVGGQVLNPYDVALTPSGSSSGSAAAVALGLAPLAVGTETDGSITSPAAHQSLVGFKPTLGLVSRSGIVPIAPSQDTAGPMAATVADAALLLAAMAGPDTADPATERAGDTAARLRGWTPAGDVAGGTRLAVAGGGRLDEDGELRKAFAVALGAVSSAVTALVDCRVEAAAEADELFVLHYEFAPAFDRYLAGLGAGAGQVSLRAIRDWNRAHSGAALKYGQAHVDAALAMDHRDRRAEYLEARERDRSHAEAQLESALEGCDAAVFPAEDGATWAARAGWPCVALPAGYLAGSRRPFAVTLVGRPWTDDRLLSLASGLERLLPPRRPPWEVNPAVFARL